MLKSEKKEVRLILIFYSAQYIWIIISTCISIKNNWIILLSSFVLTLWNWVQIHTSHISSAQSHLWPMMTTLDNADVAHPLGLWPWVCNKLAKLKRDRRNFQTTEAAASAGLQCLGFQRVSWIRFSQASKNQMEVKSLGALSQLDVLILVQRTR